jgi:hypothetical protein
MVGSLNRWASRLINKMGAKIGKLVA